jgi:hypothetical protein
MSVTCRDIARRALRKLSRVAAGAEPDGDDLNDAIDVLQGLYTGWASSGAFGELYDVVATTTPFLASPQQRVNCRRVGGVTVTLPDLIDPAILCPPCGDYDYGFRSYYCGSAPLPPHDGACIQVNDAFSDTSETWLYNSKNARWVKLEDLTANSEAPLGNRYTNGLAAALAEEFASEFGMQVPPKVANTAALFLYALTHRYDSTRSTQYDPGRYF